MADEIRKNGVLNDDVNRRQFFLKLGLGSLGIAAAGTAAFAYQYLDPNVLYEPSPVVNAGKPDRYPLGSVTIDVNSGIYIIHSDEGYFSLERSLHSSWLHDCVEAGTQHDHVSLSRQQVQ